VRTTGASRRWLRAGPPFATCAVIGLAVACALLVAGCGGGKSASEYPDAPPPPKRVDLGPIEIQQGGGQRWPAPLPHSYNAAPGKACERLSVAQSGTAERLYFLVPAPPGVSATADGRGRLLVRWRLPKDTEDCRPRSIVLRGYATHGTPPGLIAETVVPLNGKTAGVSRLPFTHELASRKPDMVRATLVSSDPSGLESRPGRALVALPDCRPGGPSTGCTLGRPPIPTTPAEAKRQIANSETVPGRLRRVACGWGSDRSIVCDVASVVDAPDGEFRHQARVIIRHGDA
jgi:hypothetical protein